MDGQKRPHAAHPLPLTLQVVIKLGWTPRQLIIVAHTGALFIGDKSCPRVGGRRRRRRFTKWIAAEAPVPSLMRAIVDLLSLQPCIYEEQRKKKLLSLLAPLLMHMVFFALFSGNFIIMPR